MTGPQQMTFKRLVLEVIKDDETTMYWMMRHNLLKNSLNCQKCGSSCRIIPRKGSFAWRCPRKGCQAVSSVRSDSFFAGSHLKLDEILAITYWWARGSTVSRAMHETGHSSRTIVDWYNFHRDVCAQYLIDHPVQVGGPGKTVEIDESKFGRRKYHRGRYQEGHWVFGGVERGSGDAFMVEVQNRTTSTLLPIIQQYVRPGTTVLSDEWRAYSQIPSLGMTHQTVNHSLNFVDLNTRVHTKE